MTAVVVVGAQWGDEGKGKIVDIFTEHADHGNSSGTAVARTRVIRSSWATSVSSFA